MAARTARAVGAVPGTTSDRREDAVDLSTIQKPTLSYSDLVVIEPHREARDQIRGRNPSPEFIVSANSSRRGSSPAQPRSRDSPESPRFHGESNAAPDVQSELQLSLHDHFSSLLHELEHVGTLQIVMLLDREGRANSYRMRRQLPAGQKALDSALGSLTRARLVLSFKTGAFPFSTTYQLTERGKALAKTMRSWPEILTR